jgi:hypothetical protein
MRATLAAAALHRLDGNDEIALRAHLDGCAACRAELRDLQAVADALPLADIDHVSGTVPQPPGPLADLVLDRVARERTTRRARRRRLIAVPAAAVLALAAAIVAFIVVTPDPARTTRVAFPRQQALSASATLRARASGTEVKLHIDGLHDGDVYWLWLTGDDRRRIAAGTFRGTDTRTDLVMTAGIHLGDARRIWVTDEDDRVVLDAPIPRGL